MERSDERLTGTSSVRAAREIRLEHRAVGSWHRSVAKSHDRRCADNAHGQRRCRRVAVAIGDLVGEGVGDGDAGAERGDGGIGVVGCISIAAVGIEDDFAVGARNDGAHAAARRAGGSCHDGSNRRRCRIGTNRISDAIHGIRIGAADTGHHVTVSDAGRVTGDIDRLIDIVGRDRRVIDHQNGQCGALRVAIDVSQDEADAVRDAAAGMACARRQYVAVADGAGGSAVTVDRDRTICGGDRNRHRSRGCQRCR